MINNEFRILLEAYAQASSDGDKSTADVLLKELNGLVFLAHHERVKAEKTKGWAVG